MFSYPFNWVFNVLVAQFQNAKLCIQQFMAHFYYGLYMVDITYVILQRVDT